MNLLSVDNLVFVLPLAFAVVLVVLMGLGGHAGAEAVHAPDVPDQLPDVHADHPGASQALGVGRVPLAITVLTGAILWGCTGLALGLVGDHWGLAARAAVAGAAALLGTRLVSRWLSRVLPSLESYGTATESLVGKTASVVHEVNESGGMVRLVDEHASLRDLSCRAAPGEGPLACGTIVRLTDFDSDAGVFTVRRTV
ncbi:MAG: hypothetical protein ACOYN0_07845 [Phycisphaerales bacterium]